jgi:hypothetical protein
LTGINRSDRFQAEEAFGEGGRSSDFVERRLWKELWDG